MYYPLNVCTGKWYFLLHRPRGRITSPEASDTVQAIRKILSETLIAPWEPVPFPTPLHIDIQATQQAAYTL